MTLDTPRRFSIIRATIACGRQTARTGTWRAAVVTAQPTSRATTMCSAMVPERPRATRGSLGGTNVPKRRASHGNGTRRSTACATSKQSAASISKARRLAERPRRLRSRRRIQCDDAMLFQLNQKLSDFVPANFRRDVELIREHSTNIVQPSRNLDQFPNPVADRGQPEIVAHFGAHHDEFLADLRSDPIALPPYDHAASPRSVTASFCTVSS